MSDSDSSSSDKSNHDDRSAKKNGAESRRHHRSTSDSSHSRSSHRHAHKHRHSSRSSGHRRHESRRRRSRSRSRDRSRRHSSRAERHSSSRRGSSRHSARRSRSRSRSYSPANTFDRAMAAQEKLARRLERAKEIQKRKEEQSKSSNEKVGSAVKKAADLVSESLNYEGMSAKANAQVEALRAKAFAETGIEVPKYYNPLAINPMNYAHQAAKRKKLWAKKDEVVEKEKPKEGPVGNVAIWSGVKFGDSKSDEKFAKLMGIRGEVAKDGESSASSEIVKKQAEVFQNLDLQYQQARLATHTQRGVGLGFSATYVDPNMPGSSK